MQTVPNPNMISMHLQQQRQTGKIHIIANVSLLVFKQKQVWIYNKRPHLLLQFVIEIVTVQFLLCPPFFRKKGGKNDCIVASPSAILIHIIQAGWICSGVTALQGCANTTLTHCDHCCARQRQSAALPQRRKKRHQRFQFPFKCNICGVITASNVIPQIVCILEEEIKDGKRKEELYFQISQPVS